MRSRFSIILIFFISLVLFSSCGDEESSSGPKPSEEYYIKFKAGDEWKIFETSDPGYQSCGQCACSSIPPIASDYCDLNICNDEFDWITSTDIVSWNGTGFNFSGTLFPIASFYYSENGIDYSTEGIDQAGSFVSITSITPDGTFGGTKEMFKVAGTFQCNVSSTGGGEVSITKGSFFVRYSED